MPSYKLTYFPIGGRAEVSRWIFAVAKQPYTDDRIKWEDWPKIKPTTPFGQLPVLTIDNKVTITQSHVIDEYLARQFNLAGATPEEQARAAMIGQCCEDAMKPLFPLRNETDAKKAELVKKYHEVDVPQFLTYFENLLKSNGGGDGYFVGNKLTYADLAVVFLFEGPRESFGVDIPLDAAKFPKLAALKVRVEADPGLAEWLKNRPAPVPPPK